MLPGICGLFAERQMTADLAQNSQDRDQVNRVTADRFVCNDAAELD
jgi:hypothetical protein